MIRGAVRVINIGGVKKMTWKGVRHKFNAIRTECDGISFSSKREAKTYEQIKLRKSAGEVLFFLRQVPLHLAGGVKYVVDFLLFNVDGSCHFVDSKGMRTPLYIAKKKMVEATYPITIEEV